MNVELVDFNASDGVKLNGFIKKNNSDTIIISTHGMGSNCFKKRDRVIAEKLSLEGIDYFFYNNRGSSLARMIDKDTENGLERGLYGTSYEDVLEGYYDIKGAIIEAINRGYKKIYLQGHSLGSTKTVYTYNRLKNENDLLVKYIKGIILLSLVNIPRALQVFLEGDYNKYLSLAETKLEEGKALELMPRNSFIQPISVKTYLKYAKFNKEFDFARYNDKKFKYDVLNSIDVPLFMRWGNVNEMIEEDAKSLVSLLNEKIENENKDIDYIDGANHGYNGKEDVLAEEITKFIKKNK